MELTGGPDQPPTKSGLSLVDFCAGYVAALATLAGVWQARRDGRGCDADLSLFESALAQLTYIGVWAASRDSSRAGWPTRPTRRWSRSRRSATADGWIMVACPKQRLWERFCDAIGRPELARRRALRGLRRARPQPGRARSSARRRPLAGARTAEWLEQLAAHGVPSGPVNDVQAALADPQAAARGDVVEYEHPTLGVVRGPASPFRLAAGTTAPERGPMLGEHTRERPPRSLRLRRGAPAGTGRCRGLRRLRRFSLSPGFRCEGSARRALDRGVDSSGGRKQRHRRRGVGRLDQRLLDRRHEPGRIGRQGPAARSPAGG